MSERRVEHHAAQGRQAESHDEEHLLAACHVEHGEEEHKAHERAAEVFLEHGDGKRDAPHDEQGHDRGGVGQVEAAHAHGEHRKHLAVLRQIRGEEDHDADLRDFARLEAEPANFDPDAAAEDLLADAGEHGHEQKHDAEHHEGVFVACELVEIAHDGQHAHHERYS